MASCGADSQLLVQLSTLSSEDPYAVVATLEVEITKGEKTLARQRSALNGQPLELDAVEPQKGLTIAVTGFGDDGVSVTSKGTSIPNIPGVGETCCVVICFCTTAVFDAGACDCGSDACVDECG